MTWGEDGARALAETFDGAFSAPGVVTAAACIDKTGTAIRLSPADTSVDGRFEIGSITKTMTATLLALLAAEGRLRLDDPVGRWLSAGANSGITLRQLATHTSGLARLPPNLDMRAVDQANPWAGLTFERAEEGLRQAVLAAGRPHLYSNHGYHLLGLVLERASGLSYQQLITERLLAPLGMMCSGVGSSGDGTMLPGHDDTGEVPHWDQPLGAGGIEATIADLARYARACLHPPQGPLGAAISAAQEPQVPLENRGRQALGWLVLADGIRFHDGGTGGFSAAVLIDPARGRAVALLASCGGSYAAPLSRAGLLALAGDDPRTARPRLPGPEWSDRAREIVQLLLDGRFGELHARTSTMFQEQISVTQIDRAWSGRAGNLGEAQEIQVSCRGPGEGVVADARITFARDEVVVRISFSSSGQIAGMLILPPQDGRTYAAAPST